MAGSEQSLSAACMAQSLELVLDRTGHALVSHRRHREADCYPLMPRMVHRSAWVKQSTELPAQICAYAQTTRRMRERHSIEYLTHPVWFAVGPRDSTKRYELPRARARR
jgi:hypothetical protein